MLINLKGINKKRDTMKTMKIMKVCEVCGNRNIEKVLDLGLHPLCDDLVPIEDKRHCHEYPIEIFYCEKCFTAHQGFQVRKELLFTKTYHYRARMTGSVLSGMSELVESTEKRIGNLSGKLVLDIGSNDGSLLDFFKKKGCNTVGVEPTGAAIESKHKTYNTFFDKNSALDVLREVGSPDIITFTNVFAHIENLPLLIDNLKLLVSKRTVIIIENHYLGTILNSCQFDTFYHEHPRTYSYNSFKHIAKSLELNVTDVQFVSRYGGNIRVFIGGGEPTQKIIEEGMFSVLFAKMREDIISWKTETGNMIEELVKTYGPLRAKAFPGRAAILVKLLNLDENLLSAVYEIKGSKKVGNYVPGTRIPILPEKQLYLERDLNLPIINLAWHIPNEVRENLKKNGYIGKVIDIKCLNI